MSAENAPIVVKSQMGQFAMVPIWVMAYELTANEFKIYVVIRSYCDPAGNCYPKMRTIAERARCSVSAVRNAVQKFRRLGLLTTTAVPRPGTDELDHFVYHLVDLDPREWDVKPRDPEPVDGEGVTHTSDTPSLTQVTRVPHTSEGVSLTQVTQEQTSEQTKEQTKETSSCAPSSSSSSPPPASTAEEDEDDGGEKSIKSSPSKKRQRRDAARTRRKREAQRTILDETDAVDDLDVRALAAFYEQDERYDADDGMLYAAGVLDRDGADKVAYHLDEARDMFGDWIESERAERHHRRRRDEVLGWLAKRHPNMAGHDSVADAFVDARRAGVDDDRIVAALAEVSGGKTATAARYLAAIANLTAQIGAAA
jgi:hypothetical protein